MRIINKNDYKSSMRAQDAIFGEFVKYKDNYYLACYPSLSYAKEINLKPLNVLLVDIMTGEAIAIAFNEIVRRVEGEIIIYDSNQA